MLDCGFTIRETVHRLSRLGVTPKDLAAIVVTHEHHDHVGGAFKFARRHQIPVWLSFGTYQAIKEERDGVQVQFCRDGDRLIIGDLELTPYTVPHDAREPVQYVISDGHSKLGVLTDAGQSTPHIIKALSGCNALMIEFNHDRTMLADSSYPYSLKQRIGGQYGHLSNETAAEILFALDKSRLQIVVGAHLSQNTNNANLARAAIYQAIQTDAVEVRIACQSEGLDWIQIPG